VGDYTILVFIVVAAVFIVIVLRLLHGGMDHDRIRQYVEARGGRLLDATWVPFGPGWLGKNKDRIYEVRYLDNEGRQHHSYCKTSGWSGVYLTEDSIQPPTAPAEAQLALEEENRRLREELERLKGRQG